MSDTGMSSGPEELRVLEALKTLLSLDNDAELYREIIAIFLRDTPKQIELLGSYIKNRDLENAAIRAHSLKSTSRTIGGAILGKRAESLEGALRNGNWDRVAAELETICVDFEKLESALKSAGWTIS